MSETKCQGCLVATRRKVLTVASVLALDATGSLTRRARAEPADDRPKQGDVLVAIDSGASAAALTPSAVAVDARPIIAWPMDPVGNVVRDGSRLNKVLVLRLNLTTLSEETRACRRWNRRLFGHLPARGMRGQRVERAASDPRMLVPRLALQSA
jgi:hypothetical protein